jgi:hypothetical protein
VNIDIKKTRLFERSQTQKDRELHRGIYKTILINVIVFCSLFLLLESSYRVWLYIQSCHTVCRPAFLRTLAAFNLKNMTPHPVYGFLAPDPITGFSPADGTFVIHAPGWSEGTMTIRQGVRVNAKFALTSGDGAILAVGDSFVFGDQVLDDETWPSILEILLNRRVVNGGVSGYGTAQAVLRAEHLMKAEPYSLVILSILVNNDLARDRSVFHTIGFYKPAVIREDGNLRLTTIEEGRRIVAENFICRATEKLRAQSWIPQLFFWSHIAKSFFSPLGYDGVCTTIHPKGATDYEILEFAVARLATFSVNKVILLQYLEDSFHEGTRNDSAIEESRVIRDVANRYGVPVIDSYYALKNQLFREIYKPGPTRHHSKKGNEIIADLIARSINCTALLPGWPSTGMETPSANCQ